MSKWNWRRLFVFVVTVSIVSAFFWMAACSSRQLVITIPVGGLSVSSRVVLLLLSSLAPGVTLLLVSRECREVAFRFSSGVGIYVSALLIGFALPFSSYLGAKVDYSPWKSSTLPNLARLFLVNFALSPLWEEVIWRAYFYPKVSSMLRPSPATVVASLGWTIWHLGFLFFLYHFGISAAALVVFAIQLFFGGIILCLLFTLGRDSLAPCVLFHTAFNASNIEYFRNYNRVNDLGSYTAEAVFTVIVAFIMFRIVQRQRNQHPMRGPSEAGNSQD